MKKVIVYIILSLLAVSPNIAGAQDTKLPTFIADSLDGYIKRGLNDWNIPGLAVAIVKDGKIVFMKGYGVTRIGGSEQVDENTLFMIGSNTKAFTATALAILQSSEKMSLNDKVKKWMPEFKLKDSLASNSIMVCDLLSHRLGFETFQGDFTYWSSNLSRADVIKKMAHINAPYPFRTKWGYCNAAFVTAGELIPRITGRKWEEVVRDSILVPLKMNRTLMLANEITQMKNVALPHSLINNRLEMIPFANIDNLAPAGSMTSCVKDMTNWLITQIDNGKLNNTQVIPQSAIQAIREPHTIIAMDPRDHRTTHFYLYGLGLSVNDFNGKLLFSHTGGVDGFLSSVMFVPEEKLGIVVLTNTDQNNFFQDLTNEIKDAFFGLPSKGYSYSSLARFKSNLKITNAKIDSLRNLAKKGDKPSIPLNSFVGKYTNELYGEVSINLDNNGKLKITFSNHPNLVGSLEHLQNNTFLCTYSNSTMGVIETPFKVANGRVEGFTLRVNDFVENTPYEFEKE